MISFKIVNRQKSNAALDNAWANFCSSPFDDGVFSCAGTRVIVVGDPEPRCLLDVVDTGESLEGLDQIAPFAPLLECGETGVFEFFLVCCSPDVGDRSD